MQGAVFPCCDATSLLFGFDVVDKITDFVGE
jgi:hypothetical protein